MKKGILTVAFGIALLLMCSCSAEAQGKSTEQSLAVLNEKAAEADKEESREEKEETQMAAAGKEMSDYDFLKTTYGLSDEELLGLDCIAFVKDYELRERDFSAEEVREIISDMKEFYPDDHTSAVFSILDKEGKTLTAGAQVRKIAYYMNKGTLVQRFVADLDEQVCYIDDAVPHELDPDRIEKLKALPDKWNLFSWDSHTEGEEVPSTGNFDWKLVFELEDGSCAVYDGYTRDSSHLPDHFTEFETELIDLIEGR